MQDYRRLHERIDRACERARPASPAPEAIAELNDVLSEGFAEALLGEERLIRIEERLADLLDSTGPDRAEEVRRLSLEYRTSVRQVADLRARLAEMHERFLALHGAGSR